jgi:hypothetical protein
MAQAARKQPRRYPQSTPKSKPPQPKRTGKTTAAAPVIRILNCLPSKDTDKDWRVENAMAAGILAAAPIPKAKDLREKWWTINDQGSTGSCVGWATADSVVRWHFVKAGRIRTSELVSPRFVWMASKETDEFTLQPTTFIETDGTSLKAALDIVRKYGCVSDAVLPFGTGRLYPGEAETFYALASQLKIASYINLGRQLMDWRRWIATKGPILTRLDCDNTWMKAKQTGGRLETYDPLSRQGGHAVALVGYDDDMFIVRNSWGTSLWGDQGFGYASNVYAAAAFTEAYGVSVV